MTHCPRDEDLGRTFVSKMKDPAQAVDHSGPCSHVKTTSMEVVNGENEDRRNLQDMCNKSKQIDRGGNSADEQNRRDTDPQAKPFLKDRAGLHTISVEQEGNEIEAHPARNE